MQMLASMTPLCCSPEWMDEDLGRMIRYLVLYH